MSQKVPLVYDHEKDFKLAIGMEEKQMRELLKSYQNN
jgi:hypothetical protein